MTDEEIENLVKVWLLERDIPWEEPHSSNGWATDKIMDLGNSKRSEDAEQIWRFILCAYNKPMSERAEALFAADPVENLLSNHGIQYIDRVERLAAKDERFRYLLGGVWRSQMPIEVWSRLKAARDQTW